MTNELGHAVPVSLLIRHAVTHFGVTHFETFVGRNYLVTECVKMKISQQPTAAYSSYRNHQLLQ